jgi:hypothetical protein
MPVGILFARFPLFIEFSVLIFHILLVLLDVCWHDLPLLFGSGGREMSPRVISIIFW